MSEVVVPYDVVLGRHPLAVRIIMKQVRSGKAKDKDTDPTAWKWTYSWGTRIDGSTSFAGLLSGKHEPYHLQLARMTLDERVADAVARSKPVPRGGRPPSGRPGGYAGLPPDYFPPRGRSPHPRGPRLTGGRAGSCGGADPGAAGRRGAGSSRLPDGTQEPRVRCPANPHTQVSEGSTESTDS